ncbi:ferrochelatase [Aciduricibacillus chroicocephali]|uniref:Ferrochelatase n=1 Tax=Aciduricibacillus chroicocephali TaxID=3054939 RepID=A0ABY9KTA5_9BACI|nr:ferrochelatase [Bacillaceae bacterium 44XB]
MKAILLMGYGAPESMDDIGAYYASIHHRKSVGRAVVKKAERQFYHHGTGETLGSIAKRQATSIEIALDRCFGMKLPVYSAFRHTAPFADRTVEKMLRDGVTGIYLFTLKPIVTEREALLNEKIVEKELKRLNQAEKVTVHTILPEHIDERWVNILANRAKSAWTWLPEKLQPHAEVIFTAHSVAGKATQRESYDKLLKELASAVADIAGLKQYSTAYRSAGRNRDMWSGPDILEVIREKSEEGCKAVIAADLQSLAENIETAFDIGYDLQELCSELDMKFLRAAQPNDSFDLIIAAAEMIADHFK